MLETRQANQDERTLELLGGNAKTERSDIMPKLLSPYTVETVAKPTYCEIGGNQSGTTNGIFTFVSEL